MTLHRLCREQRRIKMKNVWKKSLVVLALLSTTVDAKEGEFLIGLESYGLSAKYDVTDKITAQGIVGVWGYDNLTTMTARGLYKFHEKENYDFYGYGAISSWSWDNAYYDETVIGFGAGVGAEYDIRGIDPDFIPLYVSADLGFQVASFEHYGGFSGLGIGFGIHYKFEK